MFELSLNILLRILIEKPSLQKVQRHGCNNSVAPRQIYYSAYGNRNQVHIFFTDKLFYACTHTKTK